MRWLASLFEVTAPTLLAGSSRSPAAPFADARERATHLLILAAIVAAGALVRFWGLGNVGLHGDEETMAMAVRHILEDGRPILPSGMFYPRGLTQLYLMAASVGLFGESEWALRLPSVLCGVALIGLAYLAGRRFLRPHWNLAFTAAVALLPDLITSSQTARMYIFMLATIAASMVFIFAWERSDRIGWLLAAVAMLILGLDFQALAVTSVLLLLLPGILHQDFRKLTLAVAAVAAVMVAYALMDTWVNSHYPLPPAEFAADFGRPHWRSAPAQPFALSFRIALWAAGVAVAFFALRVGRSIAQRMPAIITTLLLLAAVLCQLILYYHLAGLLIVAAFVIARRHSPSGRVPQFWIFAIGSALIALIQVTLLAARPGSLIRLVGAMVGQPSVWQYVKIATFSEAAAILTVAALAWGLYRLSSRRPAPDYSLLAVLGICVPLFAIGFFLWNVPPRYTAASLLPLLLCAFALAQAGTDWIQRQLFAGRSANRMQAIAAVLTSVLVINPHAAAAAIDSGYASHPDHKGAAAFIRSQRITPEDIVIAEDVLQQTYYLGAVDYWLIGPWVAQRFVERVDGRFVDFYTRTPVICTAADLDAVLRAAAGKRVFVIGSGENQQDRRRVMRGPELSEALRSDRFEVIFTGRDKLTKIWRALTPAPPKSAGARIPHASAAPPSAPTAATRAARQQPE